MNDRVGFGNSDIATPYNYGSVADGFTENPSLEQRMRKKYWKTKQTVRTKLHKQEDEFIVAGDADIDTKLERAHHLQYSCHKFLTATNNCIYHSRALSSYELTLGEYLSSYGETDFTNAGGVMKKTGATHETVAKNRMKTIPPMMRINQEFSTFSRTAIKDLTESIQKLEKARADYRAALLWMKDVSDKLHNPDYPNQLTRFREAQATVKQTKLHFEKMKTNLIEKIDMVAASRLNLLSITLPLYQNDILKFLDESANSFHDALVTLRSQTQHQYKLKELLQEIKDLESDETQFDSDCLPPTPECGEPAVDDSNRPHDPSLFGLLQSELSGPPSAAAQDKKEEEENKENQLSDLLDILGSASVSDDSPADTHVDEWDQFSSFVGAQESSIANAEESDGIWGDELLPAHNSSQQQTDFQQEIDELLAMDAPPLSNPSALDNGSTPLSQHVAQDTVFDPLESSANTFAVTDNYNSLHDLGLSPASQSVGQPLLSPLLPVSDNTSALSTGPSPKDKAAKTSGTSWMNVFAHLDPIANEKV